MKHLFPLLASAALLAACQTAPSASTSTKMETGVTPMASAKLDSSKALTRIAFGSCLNETKGQTIWNTIAADDPDLFLFIGDNVYGDSYRSDPRWPDPTMPKMRKSYNTLAAVPEFANFRAQTPLLTTWDDHDYGANDGGAYYPFKKLAEQIYLDAWDVPANDERRSRDGVHTSKIIGPEGQRVQIIMLDTRYFRTDLQATNERNAPGKERYVPMEGTHGSMLGESQWNWLAEELKKPADLRLLVSSIQVHADGHGWEAWRTMPAEREKLYNLIDESGAEGVVILSGDRHAGSIYLRDDVVDYPLYEVTASSLNLPASDWRAQSGETGMEAGPYRVHPMQFEVNYGLVDVDWDARTASLKVVSPTGGDFVNSFKF
ncbi:MAG: alkaline phosphatase D family protein [Litorimonas sp.]